MCTKLIAKHCSRTTPHNDAGEIGSILFAPNYILGRPTLGAGGPSPIEVVVVMVGIVVAIVLTISYQQTKSNATAKEVVGGTPRW